jgi:predicted alpha/beta hydrolase
MNLKSKPASSKRANLPREIDLSKAFIKDWKRLEHSGRYDMLRAKLEAVGEVYEPRMTSPLMPRKHANDAANVSCGICA